MANYFYCMLVSSFISVNSLKAYRISEHLFTFREFRLVMAVHCYGLRCATSGYPTLWNISWHIQGCQRYFEKNLYNSKNPYKIHTHRKIRIIKKNPCTQKIHTINSYKIRTQRKKKTIQKIIPYKKKPELA